MPAPTTSPIRPRPAMAPEQAMRLCAVIRASLEGVAAAEADSRPALSDLLYDRINDIEEIERTLGCCVGVEVPAPQKSEVTQ